MRSTLHPSPAYAGLVLNRNCIQEMRGAFLIASEAEPVFNIKHSELTIFFSISVSNLSFHLSMSLLSSLTHSSPGPRPTQCMKHSQADNLDTPLVSTQSTYKVYMGGRQKITQRSAEMNCPMKTPSIVPHTKCPLVGPNAVKSAQRLCCCRNKSLAAQWVELPGRVSTACLNLDRDSSAIGLECLGKHEWCIWLQ